MHVQADHVAQAGRLKKGMGALLYRTGTAKASELGGVYKSMPLTTVFCIVGAMSISAELEDAFGKKMAPELIYELDSIRELAAHLDSWFQGW